MRIHSVRLQSLYRITTPSLRQAPSSVPNNVVEVVEGDDDEFIRLSEISLNTPENNFTLYPNPAEEAVNISLKSASDDNVTIQLKDFTGRVIKTMTDQSHDGLNIYNMDLHHLAKGIYLISVESTEIKSTKRLVVK